MFLEALAQQSTAALAFLDLGLMVLAWRLGFRSARRQVTAGVGVPPAHAEAVSRSCLGLLSLLLAFTYGTTYTKYETRRVDTVIEANAIGTFGTRLLLLPEELREPALADLRRYVELHRQLVAPAHSREERLAFDREIRDLQSGFVHTITSYIRTPAGAHLIFAMMPAMNAMLDEYEKRAHGVMAHVPVAVVMLLVLVSVVCAFLVGRAEGYSLPDQSRATVVFFVLVAAVFYVSIDLDQPWRGITRTSELPIERVAESLRVR